MEEGGGGEKGSNEWMKEEGWGRGGKEGGVMLVFKVIFYF